MFDVFAMSGNFFTVSALILAMTTTINNSSQVKLCNSLLWREITVFTRSKLRLKLLNEIHKNLTNRWQRCRVHDAFPTPPAAQHCFLLTLSNRPAADDENSQSTIKAWNWKHCLRSQTLKIRDFPSSKFMNDYFGQNNLTFKHDNQTCPHQITLTVFAKLCM